MKRLMLLVLTYLFPTLVLAQNGALTFAPPASDYSVVFLGNLFGTVDGVLHSTGSQIMGAMFMVFNSAVLALGGIIIMYTLLVSTMNTAHEGQMLGQKWSSLWIPLRSTLGLALLIPKASGYCLMQIFVMWIVVQGVGAADKVWNAALSYLNRGGVIIQAQATNPASALIDPKSSGVITGAANILSGQVCMYALQKQLEAQRQAYLDSTQNNKGPCAGLNPDPGSIQSFCKHPVPDFINTVNAVDIQNANPNSINYFVKMPNIPATDAVYNGLNGVCGQIAWNPVFGANATSDPTYQHLQGSLNSDEFNTLKMSRAIALQQMYVELAALARIIVNNDPQIGTSDLLPAPNPSRDATPVATQQFGGPFTLSGQLCKTYADVCKTWGPVIANFGILFNGTEFLGAINDYNAIMRPTWNAIAQATNASSDKNARQFINDSSAKGWIMAGSYFFNLVNLNSRTQVTSDTLTDSDSGLDKSIFRLEDLKPSTDNHLANWLEKLPDNTSLYPRIEQVKALITGINGIAPQPKFTPDPNRALYDQSASSTVFGLINNSLMVQLPGQPGITPLQFADYMNFSVTSKGFLTIPMIGGSECKYIFCIDKAGWGIIINVFSFFVNLITQSLTVVLQNLLNVVLWVPLQGIGLLFKQGVSVISQPGVNPIVALANMGVMYINFAGDLWINMFAVLIPSAVLLPVFVPVFALFLLAMPLIIAWLSVMISVSFVTAYYIPILPYMMFIFGAIGWLIAVIEAMVAAPLVALGITHPEGHEAFGKGEHAIMILMNVFLRPAMMIIGYIAAIALAYVSVWILNSGYDLAISFMQGGQGQQAYSPLPDMPGYSSQGSGSGATQYTGWAGLFAFFFSILTYTTIYLIVVQKSFNLISFLPDKVLRWIGGQGETTGQETAQWGEEAKSSTKDAGEKGFSAQQQLDKSAAAGVMKGVGMAKKSTGLKGTVAASPDASKNPPDKPPGAT